MLGIKLVLYIMALWYHFNNLWFAFARVFFSTTCAVAVWLFANLQMCLMIKIIYKEMYSYEDSICTSYMILNWRFCYRHLGNICQFYYRDMWWKLMI